MTKKVIIIDDSITVLNILKTAFAKDKWEVFGAQNARMGLKMIYDQAPDLVVTDAMMPVMGGFQLLSIIRKDEKINQIPCIIYSVMDEKNAKFYLKEEYGEYYLKKSDDLSHILRFALDVKAKHPVSEEYKFEIIKASMERENLPRNIGENTKTLIDKIQKPTPPPKTINFDEIEIKLKEKYDFTVSDDTVMQAVFELLYPILKYNLFVVCIRSFEKNEKVVYFDIRDIILSPIFQSKVMVQMNAKKSVLFKKYIPNLKMIIHEDEFETKVAFDFEYKEKTTANIAFYSLEKSKWNNTICLEKLKDLLDDFFSARYINKSFKKAKNNEFANKYFLDKFDFKFDNQNKKNIYTAVVELTNLKVLQANLSQEDLDILNSRITQKIVTMLNEDEQIYKNSDDEYVVVFFSKDVSSAYQKLECIINILDEIRYQGYSIDSVIGASDCKIDGYFNFHEAQKQALLALDIANSSDRIVIYG